MSSAFSLDVNVHVDRGEWCVEGEVTVNGELVALEFIFVHYCCHLSSILQSRPGAGYVP